MGYVLLVGAICCEVFATSMMKAAEGVHRSFAVGRVRRGLSAVLLAAGKGPRHGELERRLRHLGGFGNRADQHHRGGHVRRATQRPLNRGYRAHCCRCGAGQHVRTGALAGCWRIVRADAKGHLLNATSI